MKNLFLFLLFGIICSKTFCQIINISEIEGDAGRIPLGKFAIVDINSDLELKINRVSLDTILSRKTNGNIELLDELQRFNLLLVNQKEILELLNKDISGLSDDGKIEALGNFSKEMQTFYGTMFKNPELRKKFNDYGLQFRELPKSEWIKYNNYYIAYGIVQLNQEIANNLKTAEKTIDQKKIRIQISAYLNTKAERNRKVHVENFDDYNLGEFYEVPTWVTSFSKEDVEAFAHTRNLATNLNKLVNSNFAKIKDLVRNNTKSFSCIESSFDSLNAIYADRENIFRKNTDVASKILNEIQDEYSKLLKQIRQIKEFDGKNGNALEFFNSVQHEFISQASTFPDKIDSLASKLPLEITGSNQSIVKFISEISTCKTLLKADIDNANRILEITERFLRPSQIVANTGLDLSKDVFSYGIQDLPQFGYINLKNTGKRANLDQLEIQLTIRTPEDSIRRKPGVIIEKHILTLQQISVYSVSNVSVILADPYNFSDLVKLENKFQFAPSGSLLFKFGSRKSKAWNFIEPSIGFNISTPDFDLDGVPDIGIGGVFTLFQDVLSVGLSYDTKTDNPFWFFGLSLPFSTLGLPINTIQTNAGK